MDPVHILMDPVHGPGPRRGSMDQGSMFCTSPIFPDCGELLRTIVAVLLSTEVKYHPRINISYMLAGFQVVLYADYF